MSRTGTAFGEAFAAVARSHGFTTTALLARALGLGGAERISQYRHGACVPLPEVMGAYLCAVRPTAAELDLLMPLYGAELAAGRGSRGGLLSTHVRQGIAQRQPAVTAVGRWVDAWQDARQVPQRVLAADLGLCADYLRDVRLGHCGLSVATSAAVLARVQALPSVSPAACAALAEAIAADVATAAARGRRIVGERLARPRRQAGACQTYTGGELAREFGISRERVRQIRLRLGIAPGPLTAADRRRITAYRAQGRRARPG